jgi:hypothetical protein
VKVEAMEVELVSVCFIPARFGGASSLVATRNQLFASFGYVPVGVTENRNIVYLHYIEISLAANDLLFHRLLAVQAVQAEVVSGVCAVFDQVIARHFLQFIALKDCRRFIGLAV